MVACSLFSLNKILTQEKNTLLILYFRNGTVIVFLISKYVTMKTDYNTLGSTIPISKKTFVCHPSAVVHCLPKTLVQIYITVTNYSSL